MTLPTGGFKRPSGANGGPPNGANGSSRPKGHFPRGGAQFKARQAAFKTCGVSFPAGRPHGGQGPSTTAS